MSTRIVSPRSVARSGPPKLPVPFTSDTFVTAVPAGTESGSACARKAEIISAQVKAKVRSRIAVTSNVSQAERASQATRVTAKLRTDDGPQRCRTPAELVQGPRNAGDRIEHGRPGEE